MKEDLFKIESTEPNRMSQKEFFEKTKEILSNLCGSYSKEWHVRALIDGEHPEESVCDKCTGIGCFIYNGVEKECFQNREQGDCYHRYLDTEQVITDLEANLSDMFELLSIDEIIIPLPNKPL